MVYKKNAIILVASFLFFFHLMTQHNTMASQKEFEESHYSVDKDAHNSSNSDEADEASAHHDADRDDQMSHMLANSENQQRDTDKPKNESYLDED